MQTDVYDLYERNIREEMSLGEYDDTIVQWYLHGELLVNSYLGATPVHNTTHELITAI